MAIAIQLLSHCNRKFNNLKSVKIIFGDFIDCNFNDQILAHGQYLISTTQKDNILDHIFWDIKDSYRVVKGIGLGSSDHKVLLSYKITSYGKSFRLRSPSQHKSFDISKQMFGLLSPRVEHFTNCSYAGISSRTLSLSVCRDTDKLNREKTINNSRMLDWNINLTTPRLLRVHSLATTL